MAKIANAKKLSSLLSNEGERFAEYFSTFLELAKEPK